MSILSFSTAARYLGWFAVFSVTMLMSASLNADTVAESWQLKVHDTEVYGTRDLESGNYAESIRKLTKSLAWTPKSYTRRAPILINLCVAYTAIGDLQSAETYCDAAIDNGRDLTLAYNNRGVSRIAGEDYFAAYEDFAASLESRGGQGRLLARQHLIMASNRIDEQGEVGAERFVATPQ